MRLKKVHALFLESSRNLKEGRDYWRGIGRFRRWILDTLIPVPLLSLHQDGVRLLTVLRWLEANCKNNPLTEQTIQEYHRLLNERNNPNSGEYRNHKTSVIGSRIQRPTPDKVRPFMAQLDFKLRADQEKLDKLKPVDAPAVLELAALVHQRIAFIHPFKDANGRVARIAMNHIMRRYGMGYIILPPLSESKAHFDALEEAHKGNFELFISLAKAYYHSV